MPGLVVRHKKVSEVPDTGDAGLIQGSDWNDDHEVDGFEEAVRGAAAGLAGVPVGAVVAFARMVPPDGWLACDGAAVSRAEYGALFGVIGTLFGAGDGDLTFNLPDLRGEFVRGLDAGRGVDVGRGLGTGQADALQNITGYVTQTGNRAALQTYGGAFGKGHEMMTNAAGASSGVPVAWMIDFNASRVARTAHETRPRNVALLYCIKA